MTMNQRFGREHYGNDRSEPAGKRRMLHRSPPSNTVIVDAITGILFMPSPKTSAIRAPPVVITSIIRRPTSKLMVPKRRNSERSPGGERRPSPNATARFRGDR